MSLLPARLATLALVLLAATGASGKVFDDPTHVLRNEYDFVVIGGGTAGNVVANRLTEDKSVRVLVIEAGPSNEGVEDSIVPFFCTQFYPASQWTWNYTTVPQVGLNNRTVPYPRGRLLGGSSSVNFMVYTRGSDDDWNRYANVTGDHGWSWNALQKYFKKSEHFVEPADHHNITGQFDPAFHGFSGPLKVSLPGFPQTIDDRVVQTTKELASEYPFREDVNSGETLGVGWTQTTISGNKRSSSATAYLAPRYVSRHNLDVLIESHVTRIIAADKTSHGSVSFETVEFAKSSTGKRYRVSAKKEVIMSAGAINTPQLLMLSGLGDPATLKKFGIKALVDLPDVGQNLQDHTLLPNQFEVNSTRTFETFERNTTLFGDIMSQYNTTGTGPFVDGLANLIGWLRIPDNSSIFQNYSDPTAGPNSAHYEVIFSNGFAGFTVPIPATGNYMSILTNLATPASRGSVSLNSSDPFDFPLIDPAFLKHPVDAFVAVEAIKSARRFLAAPAWKDYVIGQFGVGGLAKTDAEIEEFARNQTSTVFHPVGTASMSAVDSKSGVVNPDLRVKNTKGLRIIDASVIPYIPAAHTQAAVYAFAERGADLIKAAWGLH
ncbi:aryl-alcohol oxidase 11 [Heterobasidion irregulare TC 32-1]|uniref:Aryl-alcohol oxidase 11 n=1 Tax=Heterobasidion irregulare (strain TC 32-1) TaxID=747525 RepID=W4JPB3_HETIT|nr:aryl-alcohol oxidase 11 [Heterobasidion irregulare TC 32-1]ETW75407.1 aryl-alcohol oxidase 11 [Heterobasidion irregulare TC 32-1]